MSKMTVEERRRRRFSKEFRKEVVGLIERGEISITDASRLYEVKAQNVREWVKRFGKGEYPQQIVIQSTKDVRRLEELERENRKLKEMIGTQQVKVVYLETLVALAKEKLGKEFEKKCDSHS
jgi:transposase-like protein